jgi:hypothetical protein
MLCPVGNVTLPTPVFIAGGALCLLAGYVAGSLVETAGRDGKTATVVSYQPASAEICLSGDAAAEHEMADDEGTLCGTWTHSRGARPPAKGDTFRFVAVDHQLTEEADESDVVIFGTVVE